VTRSTFIAGLLVFLSGCGGAERVASSAPPADRSTSDRKAVQERVATYLHSMLMGDGTKACAQFTPEYRRAMDARAADHGLGDCAAVVAALGTIAADGRSGEYVRDASKPERVIVLLQGDRAQASVTTPSGQLSRKRTALRRVGARWLIDELGVSRTG
jgi:hypothetical protein